MRKVPPEVGDRLHCAPAYRMASGLLPGGSAASWVSLQMQLGFLNRLVAALGSLGGGGSQVGLEKICPI